MTTCLYSFLSDGWETNAGVAVRNVIPELQQLHLQLLRPEAAARPAVRQLGVLCLQTPPDTLRPQQAAQLLGILRAGQSQVQN